MLACALPNCSSGGKPRWQGCSPSQACLESQEMLSISLLPPSKPHAGKGSSPTEQGRWWQPPAKMSTDKGLLSREKFTSNRISAKHSSKSENEMRGGNGAEQPFLEGEHHL